MCCFLRRGVVMGERNGDGSAESEPANDDGSDEQRSWPMICAAGVETSAWDGSEAFPPLTTVFCSLLPPFHFGQSYNAVTSAKPHSQNLCLFSFEPSYRIGFEPHSIAQHSTAQHSEMYRHIYLHIAVGTFYTTVIRVSF